MTNSKKEFNGKPIRAEFSGEHKQWLFSTIDIVAILAEPKTPRNYWSDLKRTLKGEGSQLHEKIVQLKMQATDGRFRETDAVDKDGAVALARRIKSLHTESFIEWLTQFDKPEKKFILKHKDVDVIEIELNDAGEISSIGRVLNEAHLPVGCVTKKGVDFAELRDWWNSRSIPASRERLKEVLHSQGLVLPQQLLEKNAGLSLSDQYWICPQTAELRWADINFFDNPFSEDVGDMLFGKPLSKGKQVNLSSPDNTSDGMLKKKWKIMDGKRCLIKGASLPFLQEVANEVLASRICERLGIPFVDYWISQAKFGGKVIAAPLFLISFFVRAVRRLAFFAAFCYTAKYIRVEDT